MIISARSGDAPIDRRGIGELRVGVEAKNLVAGILFSARELSEDAERELERAGRSIAVICGDQLVAALIATGVGVVSAANRAPGSDLKTSGPVNRTQDISLHAGARDFDDSAWETIEPTSLDARRTGGRLAFGWYRARITIPERVGTLATAGTSAVFEIVVDD